MKEAAMRLNPFAYISETDVRFYLLIAVGVIVPSGSALLFGFLIIQVVFGIEVTLLMRLFIVALVPTFILVIVYWVYKRFPKKIIKQSRLKEFDPKKFIDHCECIEALYGQYLPDVKQPKLMYQPFDPSETAFVFGRKNHMYIYLSGGLIKTFRRNVDRFKSILLHEMAHIANNDVRKVYLAAFMWRSLLFSLSIPIGILILCLVVLLFMVLFLGIIAGYGLGEIFSMLEWAKGSLALGSALLFFVLFFLIMYVLRNQLVRIREFYADARVLAWEESPAILLKTLEEFNGRGHSKFEILTKFHPNINERIQVLKNNLKLFEPSLWVAFTVGFFFVEFGAFSSYLLEGTFSDIFWQLSVEQIGGQAAPPFWGNIPYILIFPILMLAVNSSFHRSLLKDIFVGGKRYFSTTTILSGVKFSLTYSMGMFTAMVIINPWSAFSNNIVNPVDWIYQTGYFLLALFFILIFGSKLIQRSFSKKDAERNFLLITLLSSSLYIFNRYVAVELLDNIPLIILAFLIISAVMYILIKIKDRRLSCPNCNNRILNLSGPKSNCPKCQHGLYSWAVYSF